MDTLKDMLAKERHKVASMTVLPQGFSMTIVPQPWIPVSERLPEIGVSVLCSSPEPPGDDWVWIGQREQYGWYFPGANEMGTPTHWMPLPEPPEAK